MNKIREAITRSMCRANCSPAVVVIALLGAVAVSFYVYRIAVLHAVLVTALVLACAGAAAGVLFALTRAVRSYRAHVAQPPTFPVAHPEATLEQQADRLADRRISLSITKEGEVRETLST